LANLEGLPNNLLRAIFSLGNRRKASLAILLGLPKVEARFRAEYFDGLILSR
jgi:hypothetical protein